jgi:thiol-disulfide isomerase/thioredoxin
MFQKKNAFRIVIIVLVLSVGVRQFYKYRVAPDIAFAGLQLYTPEGEARSLADYRGKTIFLNFWATWCADCIKEMPSMVNAQQQVDPNKFVFVLISDEAPETVAAWRDRRKYPFEFLVIRKPVGELGIHAIPTTYLLNKSGEVISTKVGGEKWDAPEMIERLKKMAEAAE